ncbi:MAG: hypothetical protein WCP39_01525 [Chlamydiota bacterium]
MKTNVILSVLHLFVLFLIFGCGLFFLSFPWAPEFSTYIAQLLINKPQVFFSIGLILLGIGALFFLGFYAQHRHRFLSIEMKGFYCDVDPLIVERYLQNYWKYSYPDMEIRSNVKVLPDSYLEISVSLPSLSDLERDIFLEKAEVEIGKLLEEKLAYKRKFIFTVLV